MPDWDGGPRGQGRTGRRRRIAGWLLQEDRREWREWDVHGLRGGQHSQGRCHGESEDPAGSSRRLPFEEMFRPWTFRGVALRADGIQIDNTPHLCVWV